MSPTYNHFHHVSHLHHHHHHNLFIASVSAWPHPVFVRHLGKSVCLRGMCYSSQSVRLSVRPYVRHKPVIYQNCWAQDHTKDHHKKSGTLVFFDASDLEGSSPMNAPNASGVGRNRIFRRIEKSSSQSLRCHTADNLCLSAMVFLVNDSGLRHQQRPVWCKFRISHWQFIFKAPYTSATMSKQYSTLWKKHFDFVAKKRQQCRSSVRLRRKNCLTRSIRECCFDIVAGMDGS